MSTQNPVDRIVHIHVEESTLVPLLSHHVIEREYFLSRSENTILNQGEHRQPRLASWTLMRHTCTPVAVSSFRKLCGILRVFTSALFPNTVNYDVD